MSKKTRSSGVPVVPALKSRPPFLPPVHLREELFSRLDKKASSPITWLVAPPGTGKSTLVASYLKARKRAALWYQLDGSDTDIASFFRHFTLAMEATYSEINLPIFTPESAATLSAFVRDYFLLLGQHLHSSTLVLDNYQDVGEDGPLHTVLVEGMQVLETGLRIFILSRQEPPAPFVALASAGLLQTLGADALRLSLDDARAIAQLRGDRCVVSEAMVELLFTRSHGWTAGLILMLEQLARTGDATTLQYLSHSTFHYFAREAFAGIPESAHAHLAAASLLPVMTKSLLRELTGSDEPLHSIKLLWRRNYFTIRLISDEAAYRFHPLFREFLRRDATRFMDSARWAGFKGRAAHLLEQYGEIDEAAALYEEVADSYGLEGLLVRTAPTLYAEGRLQTLRYWLDKIAAERYQVSGWLNYWQGTCLMFTAPQNSVVFFERATTLFELSHDVTGRALAIAGIIDAHVITQWARFDGLDRWICALEQHLEDCVLSPEVMAHVTTSMFAALMFRQPDHPHMDYWCARLEQLVHAAPPAAKLRHAHMLMLFLSWRGDLNRMGMLYDVLRSASQHPGLPPIARIMFHLVEGAYQMFTGQPQAALEANRHAETIALEHDIVAFEPLIHANSVHAAFSLGDLATAAYHLDLFGPCANEERPLLLSQYHYLRGLEALHQRNWGLAEEQSRRAFELCLAAGSPFPFALSRLLRAAVMLRTNRLDEAEQQLAFSDECAERMNSDYLRVSCSFIAAQLALQRGEDKEMLAALRRLFTISRERGFWSYDAMQPDLMAELCLHALEAGIETDYVQELIRRRGLPLPNCGDMGGYWPWPVRIHALGGFTIICAGETLNISATSQRRPMALLKYLIVHAGQAVSTSGLADALWPDARGNTTNLLDVTLHRLRKLLGRHDAVIVEDGRLKLNEQCVWVDVLWFEHEQRRLHGALATHRAAPPSLPTDIQRVVGLYRGPLLKGDDIPACLLARQRLAEKFRSLLLVAGHHWEANGEWRRAIDLYERGLEEYPATEEFYLRIMQCQQALGLRGEAVATFRRCQHNLSLLLGVEPSGAIISLLQSLLTAGREENPPPVGKSSLRTSTPT